MRQPRFQFAALILVLALTGCAKQNVWQFRRENVYSDDIQKRVESKIDEEAKPLTGPERWAAVNAHEFQSRREVLLDKKRLELEEKRLAAAKVLTEAGPLTLTDCLIHSLAFNDEIQASVAEIRSLGGEKLIARSRFLPRVAYNLSASVMENVASTVAVSGLADLVLAEFGKDNPTDVTLRGLQRRTLFAHEQTVANVLSAVRVHFFTTMLKKQQLAERRKLRADFAARYERMLKLEQARRVLEVDVLTARLNVLNEDIRINSLEKEILRQKMDLLHAIGFPMNMTDFDVRGEPKKFTISMRDATDIAFKRSTRIAQARAAVFEQDRVVRQIIWDYAPAVLARGGYRSNSGALGLDLRSTEGVYAASPFAERVPDQKHVDNLALDPSWLTSTERGLRGGIALEIPILNGLERTGRFRREKALLDRNRHLLANTISATKQTVGKAYQDVLAQARQTEILAETVRISKERLRVQERLKELGKITDNELETFRERFFADQDRYFEEQLRLVQTQERLRLEMRYFEPVADEGK